MPASALKKIINSLHVLTLFVSKLFPGKAKLYIIYEANDKKTRFPDHYNCVLVPAVIYDCGLVLVVY